ncbi:MAG TPA: protein-methionine-sulfoxide reductase catalytic subunit MsrP [Verrucomicrobiae bacterium]|nr:protein-methionine-sulfoxide reductase catalytic subunit MsrP [Verrucomicrobiae bacterium]
MANVIIRPDWHVSERLITPESTFLNRRRFLKQMGLAGTGLLGATIAGISTGRCQAAQPAANSTNAIGSIASSKTYPAPRNPGFNPGWTLTHEKVAGRYNNFYEFTLGKDVYRYVDKFVTAPWPVEIVGLVEKPMKLDAQELVEMFGLEERVYRLRCVEAWAMVVPWTGFQFSKLVEKVAPKPEAKFVRFETFNRPEQAPGFAQAPNYPWPYFEGLRLDEATNPLTLVAAGIYGKPLPKQHGAPLRLVVPWKYGYKSIKSIVKIEFVAQQPRTFWETLQPEEYPFESNVNPNVPHPRWSQATERMIDTGDRIKTQLYNGYGQYVAGLYGRG